MRGTIERRGRWFCSERCADIDARRAAEAPAGHHQVLQSRPWWSDPWIWVPLSGIAVLMAGRLLPYPSVQTISVIYADYLRKTGAAFFVGIILGGVIDHFVPKEYIIKFLSGPRKRVILRSTLLGFLASSCSHGTLALTIELFRKGASTPATISFLLASPWASMSLTLILLSLFRLGGLIIIAGALAIALITGLVFQRLARRGLVEANPNTGVLAKGFSIRQDLVRRFRGYRWSGSQVRDDLWGIAHGMIPLGRMVIGWYQLGLLLSALAGGLVPHHAVERFFGPTPGGLLLTLGAATLIEVCSEGTAPLTYELYRHTGALGNAFAFLMAGVVTDYTELAAVWKAIGRRTVLWLLAVSLPLVFTLSLILNWAGV
jgi:uncharacterized membrane protein YraQ (UPF0718 family)